MDYKHYKGYLIKADPLQLSEENDQWTINIYISSDRAAIVSEKHFQAEGLYDRKQEAVQHCFNFGMQVIDGQVPDCSIKDF